MRWPWTKGVEVRDGYTDTVLRILQGRADGGAVDVLSTAAVEIAAGWLSRSFAGVTVEGSPHVRAAMTPSVLAAVGRSLVRAGEYLAVIDVGPGGAVRLFQASAWTIAGGVDPDTWTVRASIPAPDGMLERVLPWSGCIYVAWGGDPMQPHKARGPVEFACETARLLAATDHGLADEIGGPTGQVVAVPGGREEDDLGDTAATIGKLRGGVMLAETSAGAYGGGAAEAPRQDWALKRVGGTPPVSTVTAQRQAVQDVMAACGLPSALHNTGDGTAAREGLRRWTMGTMIPLLRILCAETELKLEGECSFAYDTYPLDMVGRSKVYMTLRGVDGFDDAEARRLAGIDTAGRV